MKKVLIITYYWPPTGGSGVQRWLKFAKYLPSYGWQPVIFTPENPEQLVIDNTLEREIPKEAEVVKYPILEPYSIYRKLTGKGGLQKEVNVANSGDKSLMQRISMWVRGNFFVPDPRCMWIRPAGKFLKKYLKEHPVDVIVTTGPPHSMHIIGRNVSNACGIPWVADFRDPWTEIFYFKHITMSERVRRLHKKLEQSVLDSADRVVCVTSFVQRNFQKRTNTPVAMITNGWDKEDFPEKKERSSNFTVTHTGLFASNGNPDTLWKVLGDICREDTEFGKSLEIRLVGKTDAEVIASIKEEGLRLTDRGYCPHSTAIEEQCKASVLILPLRKEPELKDIIPGKLFEYMASGRPILGLGEPEGIMAEIISESRCGITADWDDYDTIRKEILRLWKEHRTLGSTKDNDMDSIMEYERSVLTGKMVKLFNEII